MNQAYQSVLQQGVLKKYTMLEEEIMKDIVRRIQKAGCITSAADWQIQRYMVLGHSTEDVEKIIREAVGNDWADTFRLYDEVIEREYVRSKSIYEQVNAHFTPYEQNYELQQITNALIQQSNDELFNISKSLGFMVDMGNGRKVFTPLSEIYNGYVDNAITMMASGAFDYNTTIRKVVGEMTASGLRTVDYASRHSNRVDVAVRRALLTGMGQLTGRISDMNGTRLGTDKFEVDWHPGARPDHAAWQGRVWTRQQLTEVCGLGTGPGLLGWNCRHTYYPFLDGLSVRNYSDEWLEAKAREEAVRKPYRGKEYNLYEATQKQRQMETAMRAQREKAQLLQQAKADKDDIINAKCKYQAMLDEYSEFSKKFNLPEQRERIYYDLRGRVAPSQRTYQKWQAEQAEKAAKRAEEKAKRAEKARQKAAADSTMKINGVPRGKPMTFEQADTFKVNPNYRTAPGYSINCQSCVPTFEARQRGYDVQTKANTKGSMAEQLSRRTNLVWIDPETGDHPKYILDENRTTAKKYLEFVSETVKPGQRYSIEFGWKGRSRSGHIVNLDRNEEGLLRIKDNQRGQGEKSEWIGDKEVLSYLREMKYTSSVYGMKFPTVPKLLRLDNMEFDYDVASQIMEGVIK